MRYCGFEEFLDEYYIFQKSLGERLWANESFKEILERDEFGHLTYRPIGDVIRGILHLRSNIPTLTYQDYFQYIQNSIPQNSISFEKVKPLFRNLQVVLDRGFCSGNSRPTGLLNLLFDTSSIGFEVIKQLQSLMIHKSKLRYLHRIMDLIDKLLKMTAC